MGGTKNGDLMGVGAKSDVEIEANAKKIDGGRCQTIYDFGSYV